MVIDRSSGDGGLTAMIPIEGRGSLVFHGFSPSLSPTLCSKRPCHGLEVVASPSP